MILIHRNGGRSREERGVCTPKLLWHHEDMSLQRCFKRFWFWFININCFHHNFIMSLPLLVTLSMIISFPFSLFPFDFILTFAVLVFFGLRGAIIEWGLCAGVILLLLILWLCVFLWAGSRGYHRVVTCIMNDSFVQICLVNEASKKKGGYRIDWSTLLYNFSHGLYFLLFLNWWCVYMYE